MNVRRLCTAVPMLCCCCCCWAYHAHLFPKNSRDFSARRRRRSSRTLDKKFSISLYMRSAVESSFLFFASYNSLCAALQQKLWCAARSRYFMRRRRVRNLCTNLTQYMYENIHTHTETYGFSRVQSARACLKNKLKFWLNVCVNVNIASDIKENDKKCTGSWDLSVVNGAQTVCI